jgi:hypothetical protein
MSIGIRMSFFDNLKWRNTDLLFGVLPELRLKGLSYEIEFENVYKNLQILALIWASAGFRIFQRHLWFCSYTPLAIEGTDKYK